MSQTFAKVYGLRGGMSLASAARLVDGATLGELERPTRLTAYEQRWTFPVWEALGKRIIVNAQRWNWMGRLALRAGLVAQGTEQHGKEASSDLPG